MSKADEHGPDWTDWQAGDDGPSCACGYNGTPEDCEISQKETAREALIETIRCTVPPVPQGWSGNPMPVAECVDREIIEAIADALLANFTVAPKGVTP